MQAFFPNFNAFPEMLTNNTESTPVRVYQMHLILYEKMYCFWSFVTL